LLLTRKGSRYFLPQFGTRLYEFLFEPFDSLTFNAIESDIRDAIQNFMPNLWMSWNGYWMTYGILWMYFCNHDFSPFLPRLLAPYSIAGLQNLFQMIFF